MTFQEFDTYLKESLEIGLSEVQKEQFQTYLSMLQEWNRLFNLTAVTDEVQIIEKHFLDSLLPLKYISIQGRRLLDIGSGAGFPGIVWAIVNPCSMITLLEPNNKKARFLHAVVERIKLNNVTVVVGRAEAQLAWRDKFDIAVARAVKSLSIILELAIPLLKVEGCFIAMKSQGVDQEIASAKKAFALLNCQVQERHLDVLPSDKDVRINLFIVKSDNTPNRYPRPYNLISAKPL
ncbi:MAG: 16S rRNA (guanine(527)-N(7))-methyltransferase RsmG [Bacilli bacterium]|jgi:16S rRNA (guanine527-N7)-methyltransferase